MPESSSQIAWGYSIGKKINGGKRHTVTDTLGLLVVVLITSAAVQDRGGGHLVLGRAKMKMSSVTLVWADGGYVANCSPSPGITSEISWKSSSAATTPRVSRFSPGGGSSSRPAPG